MNEISFDIDSDLRILSWNDRMESFTGKSQRMVLGKKYYEFFPRVMYRDIDAVRETLNRQRTLSIKNHLFVCPFGHLRSNVRISPVKVNRAKAKHVTITMETLTPCSLAKQWNRSQKFLAIGKIASSLAHGVKNPLNAIKGAVVYLRDRYADEKPLIEFTEIMESEISRLEHFIIQFLSSSISQNELTSVDLHALVKKLNVYISLQAYAHDITSSYTLDAASPVRANAFNLEQALLNIINNAIEAMKAGDSLSIRTTTDRYEGKTYSVIEIADTGPGCPLKTPQLADLGIEDRRGRGFGLFFAYELVKSYQGHLEISSATDTGTTVRFYLPPYEPQMSFEEEVHAAAVDHSHR